ncbi:related to nitrogen metabolic regulation protein nmr [Phialocephala subalpina]|uniref:Related to nitrogen metabolic regulation protein nmr n=1 Tax=Phialocephala subalpina TaxID=576137 RepID=A0A1L7XQX8_9HELO|nr:related to nitrogen metabolic regulation protein nmr [Phialocephala subalpina]
MSKVLAVFGATGQQGRSLINYVLNDPELSQKYKIRAITRDVNSEKSKQLKEKVEVVQGDVLNRASLETALTGAHTVFAMTTPSFGPDGVDVEYNSGKNIADVAVEIGVEYLIWSTLPPIEEISGGKFTKIRPFDVKAKVEKYIRGLPIKSAFYSPGSFMENFQSQTFLAPREAPDSTWVMARHNSPKSLIPLIDTSEDTGKFVGAILAEPDKYEGKTFCAATAFYSLEEICVMLSKSAGKTIVYKQVSVEEFRRNLPLGDDPVSLDLADIFVEGLSYYEEFGYWGANSKELVAWAVENARGGLSTFEEFLEAHPFRLE